MARIEDYALIGNCETSALVGAGRLDRLALRAALRLARMLRRAPGNAGARPLADRPSAPAIRRRRRYRPGTLVLETDYETETGAVTLIDGMPIGGDAPAVVRIVEGKRGRVAMRLDLVMRFDYGSLVPWVRRTDDGIRAIGGAIALRLRTPVALRGESFHTVADFEVAAGLVARYQTVPELDGLPPDEGAFLACSFWLADNLALQGKHAEARTLFERLLDVRDDVGLLSEEYDPGARRLLGNFPQAFSHVGLINTACNLSRRGGPAEHRKGG